MPEGPSIVIAKETLQFLTGKKIVSVSGNSKLNIQRMAGKKIIAFKTWGKHLLICFNDFTLRVHFMMFGSFRINERKAIAPRVSFTFKNDELNLYTCSLQFIEEDLDSVYNWEEDIMSENWNAQAAADKLTKPNLEATDALLDQHIFSGSGNIIKNEVLYLTRIHPLAQTADLPGSKKTELAEMARSYSFDFLHWKKEFTLKKHWRCYKQKTCERCDLPFTRAHLGRGKRLTFYCENCQKKYDKEKAN